MTGIWDSTGVFKSIDSVTLQRKPFKHEAEPLALFTDPTPVQSCQMPGFPAGKPSSQSTRGKNLSVLVANILLNNHPSPLFFSTVSHVTLSFSLFQLQDSTDCARDYLEILDGKDYDAPVQGTKDSVIYICSLGT